MGMLQSSWLSWTWMRQSGTTWKIYSLFLVGSSRRCKLSFLPLLIWPIDWHASILLQHFWHLLSLQVGKCQTTVASCKHKLEALITQFRKQLGMRNLEFSSVAGSTYLIEVRWTLILILNCCLFYGLLTLSADVLHVSSRWPSLIMWVCLHRSVCPKDLIDSTWQWLHLIVRFWPLPFHMSHDWIQC